MRKFTFIFGFLLAGMAVESQAQVLQFFRKDGTSTKYEAAGVDSLEHNASQGVTTVYFIDGAKESFLTEETDSVVWYDDSGSILSRLRSKGNYSNFLRLVQESELWTDQMNGATDLTVFAADDEGWQRFFDENATLPSPDPWRTATSYEALTTEQKQALLSAAIIAPTKMADFIGSGKVRVQSITETGSGIWTPIITPEFCRRNSITEADQSILFGAPLAAPWTPAGSFVQTDEACNNGYLEQLPSVLRPLGTMADVIRTSGRTDIFSAMLDSVLPTMSSNLNFDPSRADIYPDYSPWGAYDKDAAERGICTMFVPSDEEMWEFFTRGAGYSFLETYYAKKGQASELTDWTLPEKGNTQELIQQIASIDKSILAIFIRSGMQRSFAASVPSKWSKLLDNAMSPLFDNANQARTKLDTCLVANNGIVYVMDEFCLPTDFKGVTAPIYVSSTNLIMKSAIYDDYMNLNYYAYLKAPQQDITFFLPTDSALRYYFDPVSMKSRTPRAIEFYYVRGSFPVMAKVYNYYALNGTIGNAIPGSSLYTNNELINRLKDILYSHTIVSDGTQDIHSRNEYFRTLGGDVVKVERDDAGHIVAAKGTFQLDNERQGISSETPGVLQCNVEHGYESLSNGQTYTLDAPLVPTYQSLYSRMPQGQFYNLCNGASEYVITGCGLVDESLSSTQKKQLLRMYSVFVDDNGLDMNFAWLTGNTPYTAYIPTDEALQEAIAKGLPTWEDIEKDYDNGCSTFEDSLRIAGKIMLLTNVIRAHFHFGFAIADKEPFQETYTSLFVDRNTLLAQKLKVSDTGSEMTVTDWNGKTCNVVGRENIFVRDHTCSSRPTGNMRGITINGHRAGVVHQIDGVLGFSEEDVTWK